MTFDCGLREKKVGSHLFGAPPGLKYLEHIEFTLRQIESIFRESRRSKVISRVFKLVDYGE